MKIVYTCITGEYDKLLDPTVINKDWKYFCYTNSKSLSSEHWDIIHIENEGLEDKKLCRYYKTNFHKILPKHDISIYIDGNMRLTIDPEEILSRHYEEDFDMIMVKHDHRFCVYEEALACVRLGKDNPEVIQKQINSYRLAGLPKGLGLPATGFMIRKPVENVNRLMEQWFSEIKQHSNRDQLSFDYVIWSGSSKPSIKYITVKDRDSLLTLELGHLKRPSL